MKKTTTVGTLIVQGIKASGKKIEEVADEVGVSPRTLQRHKAGESKNGYTERECMIALVEKGIIEPQALPAYCQERCLIGDARKKYHLKGRQLPWWQRQIKKIKATLEEVAQ